MCVIPVARLLDEAKSHHGRKYSWIGRFGDEANDCSGHVWETVVESGAWGSSFPSVSSSIFRFCWEFEGGRLRIPFAQAVHTPGALIYMPENPLLGLLSGGHIAFVLSDGMTSEARGRAWGVGSWPIAGRTWSSKATLVPGVEYAPTPPIMKGVVNMSTVACPNKVAVTPGKDPFLVAPNPPSADNPFAGKQFIMFNGASVDFDAPTPWLGLRVYTFDGQGGREHTNGVVLGAEPDPQRPKTHVAVRHSDGHTSFHRWS